MATEHPLGKLPPSPGIKRLKRLAIYVKTDGGDPTQKLTFHIAGYDPADTDGSGGVEIKDSAHAGELIDKFRDDLAHPFVPRDTPLDFPIEAECIIALKLLGDFWEFSETKEAVTTKASHPDDRYYGLREHGIRCVSFCAKEPEQMPTNGSYVRHGINFNVDFTQPGSRLPVLIDPDIENRGGGGI